MTLSTNQSHQYPHHPQYPHCPTHPHYPREHLPIPEGVSKFDRPGFENDVEITRVNDSIKIDRYHYEDDITINSSGGSVKIDRNSIDNDVEFRVSGGKILVDRFSISNDMEVKYSGNTITMDYDNRERDVTIKFSGSTIYMEGYDYKYEIPISSLPKESQSKPNLLGVSEYIKLDPLVANALDRWSQSGKPDVNDLVRMNRLGEVVFYDHNFR